MRKKAAYLFSLLLPVVFPGVPVLAQTCVPSPPGLVALYRADGNAIDSIAGRDGVLVNGATFGTGKVNQAFDVTGNRFTGTKHVRVLDDPAWTLGDNPFTIELWVNFNELDFDHIHGRYPFVAHDEGAGPTNKYIFWFDYAGHSGPSGPALRFHINSPTLGAIDTISYPWSPVTHQWYHLAVTRSANTYALYIDGVQVATSTDTHTIPDADAPLTIGGAEAYFTDGLIDEVSLYNRALSPQEIAAIFAAGSAGKCAYPDADNDGYTTDVDCNDNNPAVHPNAQELCNSIDDDCDSVIDSGFDVGVTCTVGLGACSRTGTKTCTSNGLGTECNQVPGTPSVEGCNTIDDDCDGSVDESPDNPLLPLTQSCYTGPVGTLNVGICHAGTQTCQAGVFETTCQGQVTPTTEICGNGTDEDCNGSDLSCITQAITQINTLLGSVQSLGLPQGTANSLVVKLNAAIAALQSGDVALAQTKLTDFINEVTAQRGKKIPTASANALIAHAQAILNILP